MRGLSRRQLTVGAVVGAILGANLLVVAIGRLAPEPGGPPSSSYATAPDGVAAYAELLERHGHPVRRLRAPLDEAELDPGTTVIVLDPERLPVEAGENLERFVRSGGVLVAGDTAPRAWLRELLEREPRWSPEGAESATPLAPVAETEDVARVRSAGRGSWEDSGDALPILADGDRTLAVVASLELGRMTLLADTSPLQNRLLGRADNAAFGLAAAGDARRPVLFVESVHGYGLATGFAAVPRRWYVALVGLALAALLLMWARGRRLGPPEADARELPPPRRLYVDSLATVLARTKDPAAAAEPIRVRARERLAHRAGLPQAPTEEALERAARRAGLAEAEVAAVLRPSRDEAGLLAVAAALARIESGGRGR